MTGPTQAADALAQAVAAIRERRANTLKAESVFKQWTEAIQLPRSTKRYALTEALNAEFTKYEEKGYPAQHNYAPEVDTLLDALADAEARAARTETERAILDEIAELYRQFVGQELKVLSPAILIGLSASEGKKLDKIAKQAENAKLRLAAAREQLVTRAADGLTDDNGGANGNV